MIRLARILEGIVQVGWTLQYDCRRAICLESESFRIVFPLRHQVWPSEKRIIRRGRGEANADVVALALEISKIGGAAAHHKSGVYEKGARPKRSVCLLAKNECLFGHALPHARSAYGFSVSVRRNPCPSTGAAGIVVSIASGSKSWLPPVEASYSATCCARCAEPSLAT